MSSSGFGILMKTVHEKTDRGSPSPHWSVNSGVIYRELSF